MALVVAFYYLSYRYPFQINSSMTSPSYQDTPATLQAAKYGLFVGIAATALVYFSVSRARRPFIRVSVPPLVVLGLSVVALWPVAQAMLFGRPDLVETGVFFVLTVLYLLVAPELDVSGTLRTAKAFVVIALAVNLLQIGLYLAVGRLPALAYEGTTSIRFGSLWDDPNGFAVVIAYLLPVAAVGFRRFRILMVLLLLGSLVLTQSVTGIVATLAAVVIVWVLRLRLTSTWIPAFLVVVVIAAAVRLASLVSNPVVEAFVEGKSGSVQGHLEALTILDGLGLGQLLGFDPMLATVESGYVDLIGTEGVPFAVVYVLALLALLHRSMVNARGTDDRSRAVHLASATLSVAILVALVNLPVQSVFPLNALVALSFAFEFCTPIRTERQL
ncbi:hypothetical protein [Curtobacterium sp. PhB78]|uniref:hypothetical protein n=1 Tax=Curtobacterium sp. PhB78 TaxID=2485102 RepID=UPI000FA467C4|nr:hypothetical protein [Curtobacterium sp. PhB78]ROS36267.1 hypothetical protein EDF53_2234 [Curtobacterium sp. PhB78]